jgi:multidrug efflux system outer membrane protein
MGRASLRLAIILLPMGLAAGCSQIPDFMRPDLSLPGAYAEGPGTAAVWPGRDWWRGFGSPKLTDLIEAAERNNNDIGAAAARVLQADAQLRISGASLLPTVNGSLDASRSFDIAKSGGQRETVHSDSVGVGFSASYALDFFGRNAAAVASAKASAVVSRFDAETVRLTVLANVGSAYFRVIQFGDRLDVARRNLANSERVLAIVQSRVRNGAASPLDLAQQQASIAAQRAAIPALELQADQAAHALAILIGTYPGNLARSAGSLLDIRPPSLAPGLPSELLNRRPDVQAAEWRLAGADADIGAARAAFFPSIDLTVSYNRNAPSIPALFDPLSAGYALATGLAQPIFRGGALKGGVERAQARRGELVESYRQTILTALGDVEDAMTAVRLSALQETLQAEAVAQAGLAFQLAETRYREGAVDLLTVLDAQRSLNSAEDQLVQVRFTRLNSVVSLYKALGGGWRLPPGMSPAELS